MAIPSLLNSTVNSTSSNTMTSGSFTPTANSLLIVFFFGLSTGSAYQEVTSGSSTITGQETPLVLLTRQKYQNSRKILGGCLISRTGSSPNEGTVTVNWNGGATNRNVLLIYEIIGADTTYPIGAIGHNYGADATLEATLNGTPLSNSLVFAAVGCASTTTDPAITAGSGFTELTAIDSGGSSARVWVETMYDEAGADTTADWASLATVNNVGLAIEIKMAGYGDTGGPYTYQDGFDKDVCTGADNVISSGNPTYNYGGHASWQIQDTEHFILKFDLSRIPATALCVSAQLRLYFDDAAATGSVDLTARSIASGNAGWLPGSQDIALAAAGVSCWNALAADGSGGVTTAWAGSAGLSTSGTDYETTALCVKTVDLTLAVGSEVAFDLLASRVEGWFGPSNSNYGILITCPSAGSRHFGQANPVTTAYTPVLVVVWEFESGGGGLSIPIVQNYYRRRRIN